MHGLYAHALTILEEAVEHRQNVFRHLSLLPCLGLQLIATSRRHCSKVKSRPTCMRAISLHFIKRSLTPRPPWDLHSGARRRIEKKFMHFLRKSNPRSAIRR